jgi:hypothetical protein
MTARPIIVCLCGSVSFRDAFEQAELEEALAGRIVLSVASFSPTELSAGIRAHLDELHLRKIELADEVLILNVGGYVGKSTMRQLAFAQAIGKRVRFLNQAEGERLVAELEQQKADVVPEIDEE